MWKIINSLLFFFVYMNCVSSLVVFPFKISENNQQNFNLRNDLHSSIYLGESKQLTDLYFNSEDHLYFIDDDEEICKGQNFFTKNFSSYEQSSYTIEIDETIKAVQIKETIYLYKDLNLEKMDKIENFPFLMKLKTIQENKGCFLFGTLYRTTQEIRKINFIEQLKKLKLINGYAWTFKYTSDNEGLFILGEEPHIYDSNNYNISNYLTTLPQINLHSYGWTIDLDKVYSGENQLPNSVDGRLSFSNNYILADSTYNKTIYKQFFSKYIDKEICYLNFSTLGQSYYYCEKNKFKTEDINKFPKLIMTNIKLETNFSFTGKELFYEGKDFYYFKIHFNSFSIVGWVLGQLFIRKYQLVFNYDKKTIGYYNDYRFKPEENNDGEPILPKTSDKIYFYIFIPLSVVVLGAIIFILIKFVCCNKNRKKKEYELPDENPDDYLNINNESDKKENNEDDNKLYKSNE